MKTRFATLILSSFALVATHAQRVQWISTNGLPASFTNASVAAVATSDGAGGTAWLLTAAPTIFVTVPIPIFITSNALHLLWLNKSGDAIFNGPVAVENANTLSGGLVRMTRTGVIVQLRGTSPPTNTFNILRRYTAGRSGVTMTDTQLAANENIAATFSGLGSVTSPPPPDKTGFFSATLGTPLLPEFVVRRYANK